MEGACQGQVTAHTQCCMHLTCVEYMCVVCGGHQVAALVCVVYMHVHVVVLGAHLVASMLATLVICFG